MSDQIRDALIRMIIANQPTIAITLGAGHPLSAHAFNKAAKEFCCRIERKANGARWVDKPADLRMRAIGFHEHPNSNQHMHASVSGGSTIEDALIVHGNRAWRATRPSGDYYCEPIRDVEAYARYITKDIWKTDDLDGVFLYAPRDCSNLPRC